MCTLDSVSNEKKAFVRSGGLRFWCLEKTEVKEGKFSTCKRENDHEETFSGENNGKKIFSSLKIY